MNSKKVEISFFDLNDDGSLDDPDIFDNVVAPDTNSLSKYIFLKKELTDQGFNKYNYYPEGSKIIVKATEIDIGAYTQYENDPQIFYIVDQGNFKILSNGDMSLTSDYLAYTGRADLKFHYVHSANESNRIDPSVSNIIDVYMLTKSYDSSFRKYLKGTITNKPLPPSVDELFQQYGQNINKIKSISDEVIYHPAKYKILFGDKADENLQAVFKVVKNLY